MTDDELDRLEALADAARPGPWTWEPAEADGVRLKHPEHIPGNSIAMCELVNAKHWIITAHGRVHVTGLAPEWTDGDGEGEFDVFNVHAPSAALIAASRTAVPALIEEIRRLRALVQ